jgi:hypothetical protein
MIERDYLWKAAFRVFMKDFVLFFFPTQSQDVDWSKGIEFLDKELHKLQSKSKQKHRTADVLVRLYLKTGKIVCILLHIEVQDYTDPEFELRMHQMRYRIEDLFGFNPVMLAILTDDNEHFMPTKYEVETWGSSSRTIFLLHKVMDNPPSTYPIPDSPVAIIMEVAYNATKTKKMKDDDIIKLHLPIVKKLFVRGYSKEQVQLLFSFIAGYVKFANSDKLLIFEEKIEDMVKYETTEDIFAILEAQKEAFNKWRAEEELRRAIKRADRAEAKADKAEAKAIAKVEAKIEAKVEAKSAKTILSMLHEGINIDLVAKIVDKTVAEILEIQEKYKNQDPLSPFLNGHKSD